MTVSANTIIRLGRLINTFKLLSDPELTLGNRGNVLAKITQIIAAPAAIKAKVLRHP